MSRRAFFLVAVAIVILLHGYIGWRLLPHLAVASSWQIGGAIYLLLSSVLIPLGLVTRGMRRRRLADALAWLGAVAMGLFSSLLVLTLLRDLLLLAYSLFATSFLAPDRIHSTAWQSNSAVVVLMAAVLMTLAGFINARRIAQVVDVDVRLPNLPRGLHGFTIVQISDVHVGPTIKRRYVQKIVARVNALQADLIAVTGDLVDGTVASLRAHTAPLGELKARHGGYVVTGNHEYYSGADEWIDELRGLGLQVLLNEHVVIGHNGAQLAVAGVTDFSAEHFDLRSRSDPLAAIADAPLAALKLLLAHQPRSAAAAAAAGFDLQLSGHTHGGQFWPWNYFVPLQQPFTAGLHRLDNLWVYVSRGTGYWGPPKRFGAASEITRLRLLPG
jgi:predicted MPP superfamily phosphohydrolase